MAITFVNDKARETFENYIKTANLGLPTSCPECGADIEVQENGQVRCVNSDCKKKVLHKFINFFKTLEIDSAGDAFCSAAANEGNTIKFLIDKGLADSDAYVRFAGGINGNKVVASLKAKLSESISAAKFISLFDLEGFGEKKLDKVEASDGWRKASEKRVKDNEGIVASGVSKTLSYLVTDDTESGSSKNIKAKQLGIPVISSFQFADMLK